MYPENVAKKTATQLQAAAGRAASKRRPSLTLRARGDCWHVLKCIHLQEHSGPSKSMAHRGRIGKSSPC